MFIFDVFTTWQYCDKYHIYIWKYLLRDHGLLKENSDKIVNKIITLVDLIADVVLLFDVSIYW